MSTNERNATMWQSFRAEIMEGSCFPNMSDRQDDNDQVAEPTKSASNDDLIQKAFFPSGAMPVCAKLLFCGWAISVLVLHFVASKSPQFEPAFLTIWSLTVAIIYFVLSFFASMAATCSSAAKPPHWLGRFFVKALSIFFPIAAVSELVVILFWVGVWVTQYKLTHLYISVMTHGPFAVLVLVDGLIINSIPVRARHIGFVWIFQCLYLAWTGVYFILDLMNPFAMNMNMDEALYEGFLNWRLYPGKTFLVALCTLFVVTPLWFALVWTLSYYSRRKPVSQGKLDYTDDTEESLSSMDETFNSPDGEDLEAQDMNQVYDQIYEC